MMIMKYNEMDLDYCDPSLDVEEDVGPICHDI